MMQEECTQGKSSMTMQTRITWKVLQNPSLIVPWISESLQVIKQVRYQRQVLDELCHDVKDFIDYVRAYFILPSTIWNVSTGPLFDAGISNPRSVQIPTLVRASIDRGNGGMVGEGKNIWPNVEVHEREWYLCSCLFEIL
jgi:hypothetical protein